MMTHYLLSRSRGHIQLGQKLAEGGEGAIYTIQNQSDYVAKIYTKPIDARKQAKLLAMPGLITDRLKKIAAWPIDALLDNRNTVCGFVMEKIAARRDIHELYSPKSRTRSFPEADFRFLSHVCCNIARAFAIVHEHGHVIGDINHGSVLVGPDGIVVLIDCDSFQVKSGGELFTCDVGMPLFTAPEIQGQSLRGLRRIPNHDHFAMAVMLFHLLCMGRHPFAGRYSGQGEMPIEKAIAELRFAYGKNRLRFGMKRPPGTPPLETFGATVSGLFEQAFSAHGDAVSRPDAKAWAAGLSELKAKLRACSGANWHHFPNELANCPWCVVESQTGVRLFGTRIVPVSATGMVDVGKLWAAIVAVPAPDPDPPLPSQREWVLPSDADIPNRKLKLMRQAFCTAAIFIGFVGCSAMHGGGGVFGLIALVIGLCVYPWVSPLRRGKAQRSVVTASADYDAVLTRWNREALAAPFTIALLQLEMAKAGLADMSNERKRRLAKLDADREANQRYRFLDNHRIAGADIRNIGVSRTAMLASYGIETAADVVAHNILQIPGFGPAYTGSLVDWRNRIQARFRFDPKEPVDPLEVQALERELAVRTQELIVDCGTDRVPSMRWGSTLLPADSALDHFC